MASQLPAPFVTSVITSRTTNTVTTTTAVVPVSPVEAIQINEITHRVDTVCDGTVPQTTVASVLQFERIVQSLFRPIQPVPAPVPPEVVPAAPATPDLSTSVVPTSQGNGTVPPQLVGPIAVTSAASTPPIEIIQRVDTVFIGPIQTTTVIGPIQPAPVLIAGSASATAPPDNVLVGPTQPTTAVPISQGNEIVPSQLVGPIAVSPAPRFEIIQRVDTVFVGPTQPTTVVPIPQVNQIGPIQQAPAPVPISVNPVATAPPDTVLTAVVPGPQVNGIEPAPVPSGVVAVVPTPQVNELSGTIQRATDVHVEVVTMVPVIPLVPVIPVRPGVVLVPVIPIMRVMPIPAPIVQIRVTLGGPLPPPNVVNHIPAEGMAQVIGHKRRGISSGETSASSSSTCQLPTLPGGTTPGTLTDELAALFECPVCFEIVLPPIMQCQVGHLVCASCRPKLSCCPTCRGTLGNIRNLAMEKVANNLMFPCKHKSTGCRMSLGLNEKAEHEEICEFRPYSCPCPGASCSWQGQLDKVMVHLQHSHKNITTLNGEDIVFLATEINLAGAVDWVMMQSCFGHHFMLVLEKQEKNDGHTQFFAIVQLIGSRKQAEHFAYRLELNGNRRRLIWEAMPRSSHEGVASAIMASDCLAFDNSIAQHFADNGNLGINVTISLVC